MAFEGGPLSVIGITPAYLTGLATQTAASGVQQGLGQVWQGAGQSFIGSAGQSLGGALAGSAVNIALNSAFGTNVPGPAGLKLDSGANLLATAVTPFVTSSVAAGINQQIQQSLQSAGPFGPALSSAASGLIDQALGGIGNALFGAAAGGGGAAGANYKMFPGGGGEPAADYGGSSYTLTDVTFSLQPANQGPQAFGLEQAISLPKSITTLPFNQLTSMPTLAGSATANALKQSAMVGGLAKAAFSPALNTAKNFITR